MWFEWTVLVIGALAGSLTFGIAGFSFGIVASSIWLQVFPPATVIALVVIVPLVLNLALVPRFWGLIRWRRVAPFMVGSTVGVPLGAWVLTHTSPMAMRVAIGVLLVVYAIFILRRPVLPRLRLSPKVAPAADTGMGFVGGFMGGTTGLSIIVPALYWALRGWEKDEQRALTQPFAMYTHVLTLLFVGTWSGGFAPGTASQLAVVVPIALAGNAVGMRLFRRMSGPRFNTFVLWIALVGGSVILLRALV